MASTHRNGVELYFEVHGRADAPPVLLIQGFGGNADRMRRPETPRRLRERANESCPT